METQIDLEKHFNLTNKSLAEISDLLRLFAQGELEKRLAGVFDQPRELSVYELSDGERSTREIEEITGVAKDTVSDLWKKWHRIGIADTAGTKKPYKAKYSLVRLALTQTKENREMKNE